MGVHVLPEKLQVQAPSHKSLQVRMRKTAFLLLFGLWQKVPLQLRTHQTHQENAQRRKKNWHFPPLPYA